MIKYLVMDVDGTLTDGKIYMGESGELFKAFDIKDGCGIKDILPQQNIVPVIITARKSSILSLRCKELGITNLFQGIREKFIKLQEFLKTESEVTSQRYSLADCAYIGDDILDLKCIEPIKKAGGLIGCPSDSVNSIKDVADFISDYSAGNGAVRQFIEYIIDYNKRFLVKEKIKTALDLISKIDLKNVPVGKYEVNKDMYYMVQEYKTKYFNECKFESHKKYIDIQWIIEGSEKIFVNDIKRLEASTNYDSSKDLILYNDSEENSVEIVLRDKSYVVLYPENAHKPSVCVTEPENIRKLVLKIKI